MNSSAKMLGLAEPSPTTAAASHQPASANSNVRFERIRQVFHIRNNLVRCALVEFFATTLFVWCGTSVSAQGHLSRSRGNCHLAASFGWALALAFATQISYRTSGGYLNPAFAFFHYTTGQMGGCGANGGALVRLIVYAAAEFLGAFAGASLTFALYFDAIHAYDGGERYVTGPLRTAPIFASYPADHLGVLGGVVDQVLAAALFCLCVTALRDRRHHILSWAQPSLIGATLLLIGLAFSLNTTSPFNGANPAADFAPRLFTLCAGYGWKVVSYRAYKWFWIPLVCPFVGACLGGWLYHLLVGAHIPSELEELEAEVRRIQADKANSAAALHGSAANINAGGAQQQQQPPQPRGSIGSTGSTVLVDKPPTAPRPSLNNNSPHTPYYHNHHGQQQYNGGPHPPPSLLGQRAGAVNSPSTFIRNPM